MMTHPPARRPEFVCRVQVSLELQSTPVSQAAFNFEANESTANAVKVEADESEEEDESPNMILEEKVRVQTDVFFLFRLFRRSLLRNSPFASLYVSFTPRYAFVMTPTTRPPTSPSRWLQLLPRLIHRCQWLRPTAKRAKLLA